MKGTQPIDAKFGVYAFGNFQKPSAQSYYRIGVPLQAMYRLGLANIYLDDGKHDRDIATQSMIGSDVALAWNLQKQSGIDVASDFANMKSFMADGTLQLPPAFVFDMDDAVEYVHPLNTSFATYGIRNWDGDFLKPGDCLLWPGVNDNQPITLWQDKMTRGQNDEVFNIERNFKTIAQHYDIARLATGVTVTTEALRQVYLDQKISDVHVFPNSVVEEDYFFPNLAPHPGVRILWEGSASHLDSWHSIQDPMIEVLNENPNAKLVVFGAMFQWMARMVRPEQLEHHEWVDYSAYRITRTVLDCDINLCPLVDSPFNAAKSAIRFYEGSLGPRPEATLAANVGPYREVRNAETGLTYDNDNPAEFKEKLTALIHNVELRKTLAANAREWVLANRSADKTVPDLFEFYMQLKSKQRRAALAAR